jgi:chromosome segregation ATPase
MMPEGNETPGGEPPATREGLTPFARGDADLLAERRARRAAEGGEAAVTRRAEAAEATVQTLELHVSSLQQRLADAQAEHARLAELLEVERASALAGEDELRRVKQREYAEQQLRVEAEDRRTYSERDSRAEIDRLTRRLGASEHHARELAERLESAQRELDEAEQDAAAELADLRSAAALADLRSSGERELQLRLAELGRRTLEIRREIDSERAAREHAERQLTEMRAGYRRMEQLVAELKGMMVELRAAAARETEPEQPVVSAHGAHGEQREELADALAAAVERLRARAESVMEPEELNDVRVTGHPTEPEGLTDVSVTRRPTESEELTGEPVTPHPSEPEQPSAATVRRGSPHKHSMSLLGRARLRRKQRRERRSAAAEPPKIQAQ